MDPQATWPNLSVLPMKIPQQQSVLKTTSYTWKTQNKDLVGDWENSSANATGEFQEISCWCDCQKVNIYDSIP
ncbi:hypothetical protein Trydic_g20178 [Trypoxylus dichotomus]